MDITTKIKNEIKNNSIVLYIKAKKYACMWFLKFCCTNFKSLRSRTSCVNILEDPQIRIKLSEYSNWPTIPQLFVSGKLIGGADITIELHQNGQLLDILDQLPEKNNL